jgi:3D (Asp-Asp-Asp) domain-containing protein
MSKQILSNFRQIIKKNAKVLSFSVVALIITISPSIAIADSTINHSSSKKVIAKIIDIPMDNDLEIVVGSINEDYKIVVSDGEIPQIAAPKKTVKSEKRVITAYNSEAAQCDASPCITANGFNVCEHGVEDTIAANFLKFGTKVKIPELFGDRVFVVRDRMNPKHYGRVDVWMKEKADAKQFGVKLARIEVMD